MTDTPRTTTFRTQLQYCRPYKSARVRVLTDPFNDEVLSPVEAICTQPHRRPLGGQCHRLIIKRICRFMKPTMEYNSVFVQEVSGKSR